MRANDCPCCQGQTILDHANANHLLKYRNSHPIQLRKLVITRLKGHIFVITVKSHNCHFITQHAGIGMNRLHNTCTCDRKRDTGFFSKFSHRRATGVFTFLAHAPRKLPLPG